MPKEQLTEQEWSHFYDVDDLESGSETITIEASDEECQDMARRLGVNQITEAKANVTLAREQGGRIIHVTGNFEVHVTQECVVSGDPVKTIINEPLEGWFADKETTVSFAAAKREKDAAQSHGEIEMVDESEDPEPIIESVIDLGELVTQHISLAIPPYPHKDGIEYEYGDDQMQIDENSPLRKNPFEALKDWKENR